MAMFRFNQATVRSDKTHSIKLPSVWLEAQILDFTSLNNSFLGFEHVQLKRGPLTPGHKVLLVHDLTSPSRRPITESPAEFIISLVKNVKEGDRTHL